MSYQGGDRYTPIDETASLEKKDIIYDETQAFSKQFSPAFTVDLSVSYKLNKKRVSHEFGLQLLNLTGYTGQHGYQYNEQKKVIENIDVSNMLPNLSYKIQFSNKFIYISTSHLLVSIIPFVQHIIIINVQLRIIAISAFVLSDRYFQSDRRSNNCLSLTSYSF